MRRITTVELDARLVDEGETDTTRVEASCAGSLVLIEATDPITGKSLSRLVNLAAEMEAARPRLLAIAITELVSASWTELASNPKPTVPPRRRPRAKKRGRRPFV